MRLIDADAFERKVMFGDEEDLQDVIYALRDFPTAYNVDKVVEDVRCRCYEMGLDESQTEIIVNEIVKQGGVSEAEQKLKEMNTDNGITE